MDTIIAPDRTRDNPFLPFIFYFLLFCTECFSLHVFRRLPEIPPVCLSGFSSPICVFMFHLAFFCTLL